MASTPSLTREELLKLGEPSAEWQEVGDPLFICLLHLNLQERATAEPEYIIDSEEIKFQQDVETFTLGARTKFWNLCSASCVSRSKSKLKQVVRQNPGIMHSKDSYNLESLHQLRLDTGPAPPPLSEEITVGDRQIQVRDGSAIPIRIYSPTKPGASGSPLVVNYHGGGFFMGNLETEVEMSRRLVTNCNAVVVDVDYRLAPEFPFPIGVDDSWDALQWVRFLRALSLGYH